MASDTAREAGMLNNKLLSWLRIVAALAALSATASPAAPDSKTIKGDARIDVFRNIEPKDCWIEDDCQPGDTCHVTISFNGPPAETLLKELKRKVDVDKELQEGLGLTVYASKDGNLSCDGTESDKPECSLSLNVSNASLERVPSCE